MPSTIAPTHLHTQQITPPWHKPRTAGAPIQRLVPQSLAYTQKKMHRQHTSHTSTHQHITTIGHTPLTSPSHQQKPNISSPPHQNARELPIEPPTTASPPPSFPDAATSLEGRAPPPLPHHLTHIMCALCLCLLSLFPTPTPPLSSAWVGPILLSLAKLSLPVKI